MYLSDHVVKVIRPITAKERKTVKHFNLIILFANYVEMEAVKVPSNFQLVPKRAPLTVTAAVTAVRALSLTLCC